MMVKRVKPLKPNRANEVMESLDVSRMSNAQLVKPPSAVKRAKATKQSRQALHQHSGEANKAVVHTNRKDPKAPKRVVVDHSRMPTREVRERDEFSRVRGETLDASRKGEMVLVNLSSRARGAGVMFNRGQISERELKAAAKLCELAERAQMSQLSAMPMGERVDGGKVDLSGSRLTSAATAAGEYRDALDRLTRCGRVLVENCVVLCLSMDEAVRLRTVANRLGAEKSVKWRAQQAVVVLREALDSLADGFHLAGD